MSETSRPVRSYFLPPLEARPLAAPFLAAPFLAAPFFAPDDVRAVAFVAARALFLADCAARPVTLRAALASFPTSFLFSLAALVATFLTAELALLDPRCPLGRVIPKRAEVT